MFKRCIPMLVVIFLSITTFAQNGVRFYGSLGQAMPVWESHSSQILKKGIGTLCLKINFPSVKDDTPRHNYHWGTVAFLNIRSVDSDKAQAITSHEDFKNQTRGAISSIGLGPAFSWLHSFGRFELNYGGSAGYLLPMKLTVEDYFKPHPLAGSFDSLRVVVTSDKLFGSYGLFGNTFCDLTYKIPQDAGFIGIHLGISTLFQSFTINGIYSTRKGLYYANTDEKFKQPFSMAQLGLYVGFTLCF